MVCSYSQTNLKEICLLAPLVQSLVQKERKCCFSSILRTWTHTYIHYCQGTIPGQHILACNLHLEREEVRTIRATYGFFKWSEMFLQYYICEQ